MSAENHFIAYPVDLQDWREKIAYNRGISVLWQLLPGYIIWLYRGTESMFELIFFNRSHSEIL